MVSLISSAHFKVSQQPILSMNLACIFPIFVVINPPKREHPLRLKREQVKEKKPKNQLLLGFSENCGVVPMCKRWEGECDTELEFKVLEFMKNSSNPEMFPSKKQLIDAGRVDLVEAIVKRGGWMSMGWDADDDDEYDSNTVKIENGLVQCSDFGKQNNCKDEGYTGEVGGVFEEVNEGNNDAQSISSSGNSLSPVPSSNESLELEKEDVSGIDDILNRLERQRNLSFGINLGKNGNTNRGFNSRGGSEDMDSCHSEGSVPASLGHDKHLYSGNGPVRSYSNALSSSLKADSWRTWSVQRAGYSEKEFEADEIYIRGISNQKTPDDSVGEKISVTNIKGGLDLTQDLNSLVREMSEIDVKNRLHYLKLELSSALCALRSNATDLSEKADEHLSEDLRQFSDASEFQETEIMHTQDQLRSMRAKLTILEGKMALAIIDAQNILDEKQKRIDDARLALQLLRTTCIVWPNSGSEVLLAGSFDGWSTQRKMDRANSGIFSLYLKLYPGQYEIKFIVDGVWMVDPLRPIVNHTGFDNNLLIIS